jgi:nitrate/TMAO reductase-like tetraheme cytochrome c subunit
MEIMSEENEAYDDLPVEVESEQRPPSLARNYISFVGMAIVVASVTSDLLLFLIEITSPTENAYIGILTYIILPSIMFFGLFVTAAGMIWERRRRRRVAPGSMMAYPKLDLNNPHTRRSFLTFLVVTFFFISASAFGSYRAFEYTESVTFCGEMCHSVMKPEFNAYKAGAHARVRCVDCHVGSGAGWYARSKLSGAYQLYSVSFNKYSRPIPTPVHNLRPARETCEQCHWPEKFYGAQMKVFDRYADDEHNTLRERRMLINVGGGSPAAGRVTGIHWHVNPANEVDYVATDEHRQDVPWVSAKDKDGNVVEYFDRNNPISGDQIAQLSKRKMDCVDCHNRPAHNYLSPDVAVDNSFTAGALDPSIPFLKKQAVAVLTGKYETNDEALIAIDTGINDFYRTNYPDIYSQKADVIKNSVTEIQRIFQNYFFPEMKTNWQTHPNNVGHLYSVGCFRCHDGQHVSKTGKVITNDCNICHTTIYDSDAPPETNTKTGPFVHPVDLGALADRKCDTCHRPDRPFKHPVDLGDISKFQCAVCHTRKS